MRRPFFMAVAGVLALGLSLTAGAESFDEGIDYQVLAQPQATETGDKVEVVELFWYGCPHCYYLEPNLAEWVARKPANAEFRRMPAVLGASWAPHARLFYAAETLGVLDRIHEPLFRAMHVEKKRLFSEQELADWVATQGVDRDEFLKAYHSFIVDMKVRRSMQMGQRYGVDGVPTVIVNGKYRTSPSITAGNERMVRVLDYLVARESGMPVGSAAAAPASPPPAEAPAAVSPQSPAAGPGGG